MDHSFLFEKVTLNNNVVVPGRLTVAPLTLFGSNVDGTINDEERAYLSKRGKGIGLYILGAVAVTQNGIAFERQPRAFREEDLPSLKERAKIIKDEGALAINQIHHGGYLAIKDNSGTEPLAPSADVANEILKQKGEVKCPVREMKEEDILNVIDGFAKATELSLKAGYDGVEIHGANNYIIQQFYSPYTNRRTDSWGGSKENRLKFPMMVIDAVCKVREKYNRPDFIIGYRLSPEEPYDGGITMTETVELVKNLITKPLQYIHISQWNFFKKARRGEGEGKERLSIIHNITKGKLALIGCGGLSNEEDFKKAEESGFCEFIAVGGASMKNIDLGTLLKEKKGKDIETELDPDHPERYKIPTILWKMCLMGMGWLPAVKGKEHPKVDI